MCSGWKATKQFYLCDAGGCMGNGDRQQQHQTRQATFKLLCLSGRHGLVWNAGHKDDFRRSAPKCTWPGILPWMWASRCSGSKTKIEQTFVYTSQHTLHSLVVCDSGTSWTVDTPSAFNSPWWILFPSISLPPIEPTQTLNIHCALWQEVPQLKTYFVYFELFTWLFSFMIALFLWRALNNVTM